MDGLKRWDHLLWPAAKGMGRLLHALPRLQEKSEPHGVILRPGGMGDLICAQMALELLGIDPRRPLWLINERAAGWAEAQGLRFRCLEGSVVPLLTRFHGAMDLVINTEQYFGVAHALALGLASKKVVGFATNRAVGLETISVDYDPYEEHEVESHLRLFSRAYEIIDKAVSPRKREIVPGTERIVCVAGRESPSRALTLDTWQELIKGWAQGEPYVLAGAPMNRAWTEELAKRCGAPIFTGNFSELISRISRAKDIFTMDGGMVHVASYYGVPTTAIFTSGREKKWAPRAVGSRLIRRKDLACQPCTFYGQVPPCPHSYACRRLSWSDVVTAGISLRDVEGREEPATTTAFPINSPHESEQGK